MGALSPREGNPLRPALAAQALGGVVVALPTLLFFPDLLRHPFALAMLQGGIAALAAGYWQQPSWWLAIHLAFMPMVVGVRMLELPTWVWPAGLVLLLLVFWRTDRSRVPLYLSNRPSADRLLAMIPDRSCRVVDLGCGDGALLRRLAQARPDCSFVGIEHAPLPWLWARLAGASMPNLTIRFGDFWGRSLAGFDLVYAFLSPAPMTRLWDKARAEMGAEAQLVSNSFPVPEQVEDERIAVNDPSRTYFYVYRPGMARD